MEFVIDLGQFEAADDDELIDLVYRVLAMSSTWLCSRNDLIANVGVLLAAGSSYILASRWPDIIVETILAGIFLGSALGVLRQSLRVLQAPAALSPSPVGPATK
jgi:Co/Zn/Cd efflux system component